MENQVKVWVRNEMIEQLQEMTGKTVYGCDLGFKIFEEQNINGSHTFSTFKAQEWVKEYFLEVGNIIDDMDNEWGTVANPFTESEKFQVQVMLWVSSELIAQCETVDKFWNEEIELTNEVIEKIVAELKEVKF